MTERFPPGEPGSRKSPVSCSTWHLFAREMKLRAPPPLRDEKLARPVKACVNRRWPTVGEPDEPSEPGEPGELGEPGEPEEPGSLTFSMGVTGTEWWRCFPRLFVLETDEKTLRVSL